MAALRLLRIAEAAPFAGVSLLAGLLAHSSDGGRLASKPLLSWDISLLGTSFGVFCLAAFAFCFNDLQDRRADRQDPDKSLRPLVAGKLSPRAAATLAGTTALVSLSLLAIFAGTAAFGLGLLSCALSCVYSWRRLGLKSVPIVPSIIHLLQGWLATTIGAWAVMGPHAGPIGFWLGWYFGLVFAAGHLHHEAADRATDLATGIRTHAVRYGTATAAWIGFGLWTLAAILFSALAWNKMLSPALGWLQLLMYLAYLTAFFALVASAPKRKGLLKLKRIYRTVYALGGLAMVALALCTGRY